MVRETRTSVEKEENNKTQITNKFQNTNPKTQIGLIFGICYLFEFWVLLVEISL